MGGELELPKAVIQRIQYFLTGREAAVTAVLSKPWYRAWLTRPNIDLDEKEYRYPPHYYDMNISGPEAFQDLVRKTIQRYEESNLKIDSFSLRISRYVFDGYSRVDYSKMIVKALEMGATRLVLSALFDGLDFVLSNEVFAAENLVGLSVEGFRIDLGPDPTVRCSRLESLALRAVGVKRDANTISNLISRCHLIKDLSLSEIYEYKEGTESAHRYGYGYGYGYGYDYSYGNCVLGFGVSLGPIEFPKLHNIRCLVLFCLDFDILFLDDLSSKFPSLKDLTLKYTTIFLEDIRVSSRSLEVLNFSAESPITRAEFDVPSIRKFTFEGPLVQSLSVKPTSREWESHLSIICHELNTLWFLELSKLASKFSQSKLHLSCRVISVKSFDYEVEELQGLPKLQVENLIMDTQGLPTLNCFALFDGLFRICRPKFITQHLLPESIRGWKTNNYYLCKTLVQQINEKCSVEILGMHSLHDLKQVNVQRFDEVVAEWQDIPLKSLLGASAIPKGKQKIRFGLEWESVA